MGVRQQLIGFHSIEPFTHIARPTLHYFTPYFVLFPYWPSGRCIDFRSDGRRYESQLCANGFWCERTVKECQ